MHTHTHTHIYRKLRNTVKVFRKAIEQKVLVVCPALSCISKHDFSIDNTFLFDVLHDCVINLIQFLITLIINEESDLTWTNKQL